MTTHPPSHWQKELIPKKGRAKVVNAILQAEAPDIRAGFPEMVLILDEDPAKRNTDPTREEYQLYLGFHPDCYEEILDSNLDIKLAGNLAERRIGVARTTWALEKIITLAQSHCNVVISLQRGVLWQRKEQLIPPTREPHLTTPRIILFEKIESYFHRPDKVAVMYAENGKNRQRLLKLARKEGFTSIYTTIPFVLAGIYGRESYRISTEGLGAVERPFTDFPSIKEMRAHSLHPELVWQFL